MSVQTSLRLSFTPTDSGEVRITDGRILGEQGREVTIDAVPREGYRFVRWEVSTSPVDQPPPVDRCEDRTGQNAGDSYCQGGVLYQPIYNSDCTTRVEELGSCGDSGPEPCPEEGTLRSSACSGTTLVGTFESGVRLANGSCGTYTETIRENDSSCQPVVTPTPCPAAGTITRTTCDGFTLIELVADGNCGIEFRVKEFLSPTCNYVSPTPTPTPAPQDSEVGIGDGGGVDEETTRRQSEME
jgi:hypothetical protein